MTKNSTRKANITCVTLLEIELKSSVDTLFLSHSSFLFTKLFANVEKKSLPLISFAYFLTVFIFDVVNNNNNNTHLPISVAIYYLTVAVIASLFLFHNLFSFFQSSFGNHKRCLIVLQWPKYFRFQDHLIAFYTKWAFVLVDAYLEHGILFFLQFCRMDILSMIYGATKWNWKPNNKSNREKDPR